MEILSMIMMLLAMFLILPFTMTVIPRTHRNTIGEYLLVFVPLFEMFGLFLLAILLPNHHWLLFLASMATIATEVGIVIYFYRNYP